MKHLGISVVLKAGIRLQKLAKIVYILMFTNLEQKAIRYAVTQWIGTDIQILLHSEFIIQC